MFHEHILSMLKKKLKSSLMAKHIVKSQFTNNNRCKQFIISLSVTQKIEQNQRSVENWQSKPNSA